jgi:hypothetical protein
VLWAQSITKFYDMVMDAVVRNIKFDVVKVVVVASPAFTNVRSRAPPQPSPKPQR